MTIDSAPRESPLALLEPLEGALAAQRGQWALVWLRFRRHRLATLGARILLAVLVAAIVTPHLVPAYSFRFIDQTHLASHNLPPRLWPFSWDRIMGTDGAGNPVVGFVFNGIAPTLEIALFGALLALALGIAIGGEAGFAGGKVDAVAMRLVDTFLTIPFLPLLLLLNLYLPVGGVFEYGMLFGLITWPAVARLVRSYCVSFRRQEFIDAARAIGASDTGILLRHIVPNMLDVLAVSTSLNVALLIVAESTLAFLSGQGPSGALWGQALNGAYARGDLVLEGNWWIVVCPGLALTLTVLSINVVGDGLRDALDVTGAHALPAGNEPISDAPGWVGRAVAALVHPLRRPAALVTRAVLTPGLVERWNEAARAGGRVRAFVRLARPANREVVEAPRRPAAVAMAAVVCVVALVGGGGAVLAGHAMPTYAVHFTSPAHIATLGSRGAFAAQPAAGGRWDLLYVSTGRGVIYRRVNASGRVVRERSLAGAIGQGTGLALGGAGSEEMAAWVTPNVENVLVAPLQRRNARPLTVTQSGGLAENPSLVPLAGGASGVLYDWSSPDRPGNFDLYLSTVHASGRIQIRRLAASGDYITLPRGMQDATGALDVVYLRRIQMGVWAIDFRRWSPTGTPLGAPTVLDIIHYTKQDSEGHLLADIVPASWALDLQQAPDGSVWAAWEGDTEIDVAHWDRRGRILLPRTPVGRISEDTQGDISVPRGLAIAPGAHRTTLFYTYRTDLGVRLASLALSQSAVPGAVERIDYDQGGDAAPRASALGSGLSVLWEKDLATGSFLETAHYRQHFTPDLATRLGINAGSLAGNLALLTVGGLAGGVIVGVLNVGVAALMLVLWLLVQRAVPVRYRWPAYSLAITGVLLWLLVTRDAPPAWVVLLGNLGRQGGVVAAVGGSLVAALTGRYFGRGVDPLIHAWITATTALSYAGVLAVLVLIQTEITRV